MKFYGPIAHSPQASRWTVKSCGCARRSASSMMPSVGPRYSVALAAGAEPRNRSVPVPAPAARSVLFGFPPLSKGAPRLECGPFLCGPIVALIDANGVPSDPVVVGAAPNLSCATVGAAGRRTISGATVDLSSKSELRHEPDHDISHAHQHDNRLLPVGERESRRRHPHSGRLRGDHVRRTAGPRHPQGLSRPAIRGCSRTGFRISSTAATPRVARSISSSGSRHHQGHGACRKIPGANRSRRTSDVPDDGWTGHGPQRPCVRGSRLRAAHPDVVAGGAHNLTKYRRWAQQDVEEDQSPVSLRSRQGFKSWLGGIVQS
jgi:hypothetical protein